MDPDQVSTEELLELAGKRLMSIPRAAELLDGRDADQEWYPVKLHRLIEDGDLTAVRIGGEDTKGFHLVDRREVLGLLGED